MGEALRHSVRAPSSCAELGNPAQVRHAPARRRLWASARRHACIACVNHHPAALTPSSPEVICMTTTASIEDVRQRLQKADLGVDSSHADPRAQFQQWFADAQEAQALAPNAMALATV